MRRAARRDSTEPEIVQMFEAHGWTVVRLSQKGVPDLAVTKGRLTLWVECKSKRGSLTEAQKAWKGPPPVIVRSAEDADRVCRRAALGIREL